jgi:hypothetical protein
MAKQKYNLRAHINDSTATMYNEASMDGAVHTELLAKDAHAVISAFLIPLNARCGEPCKNIVYQMRDHVTAKYNLAEPFPVIGLDVNGGKFPFKVLPPAASPALELVV